MQLRRKAVLDAATHGPYAKTDAGATHATYAITHAGSYGITYATRAGAGAWAPADLRAVRLRFGHDAVHGQGRVLPAINRGLLRGAGHGRWVVSEALPAGAYVLQVPGRGHGRLRGPVQLRGEHNPLQETARH